MGRSLAMPSPEPTPHDIADRLAGIVRGAYQRGWTLGTSGNFSAVVQAEPLRLVITPSGADKGAVAGDQMVTIDAQGLAADGASKPSAETSIHLAIVRARGARAISHTHSVWSTLLSDAAAAAGGLAIEGYEMLKGLSGVTTHAHREWLPVIENTQDCAAEAPRVESLLRGQAHTHGLLIRRHGLYTWGRDLDEMKRHLEILEFLLEVVGRSRDGHGGQTWRS
jgi:methylthioribulose-1-phosphate dehydratase